MARFYATGETDIVGTSDLVPLPLAAPSAFGASAFTLITSLSEYYIFNVTGPLALASPLKSFVHYQWTAPFTAGTGEVDQVWKADSGDSYLVSEVITLLATPGPTPGFTASTEQDVNQFFFKAEDKIHGSDEDDMLCGWAENDSMWGNDGSDEFYYGEGMAKDKIMDLDKKRDEIILDTDLVKNFKKLKGDVKLKNDKVVLKFDSSDKLIVYGIDNLKDLKKVVSFDDFTDFA